METNEEPGGSSRAGRATYDAMLEQQQENRFVGGYMSLMHCSESAARAVYMHVSATLAAAALF